MPDFFADEGIFLSLIFGGLALLLAFIPWFKARTELLVFGGVLVFVSGLFVGLEAKLALKVLLGVALITCALTFRRTGLISARTHGVCELGHSWLVALTAALFLAVRHFPDNPEYTIYPLSLAGFALLSIVLGLVVARFFRGQSFWLRVLYFILTMMVAGLLFWLPAYFLFEPDDWGLLYLCAVIGLIWAIFLSLFYSKLRTCLVSFIAFAVSALVYPHLNGWYGSAISLVSLSSISGLFFLLFIRENQKKDEADFSYNYFVGTLTTLLVFMIFLAEENERTHNVYHLVLWIGLPVALVQYGLLFRRAQREVFYATHPLQFISLGLLLILALFS